MFHLLYQNKTYHRHRGGKCSWMENCRTFYLKGSQKSCLHQGIHFGSHSCEKNREIGKQKVHPMTFSDMLLCHFLQQQKSGLLQTRYIMWKAFMLEYWNYYQFRQFCKMLKCLSLIEKHHLYKGKKAGKIITLASESNQCVLKGKLFLF